MNRPPALIALTVVVMLTACSGSTGSAGASPTPSEVQVSLVDDPVGDFLDIEGQPYQDIVKATVTITRRQFLFVMDLAAPVPLAPKLPPKVLLAFWGWGVDTDPSTFPVGYPFEANGSCPCDFLALLVWDRTSFTAILIDRRPLLTGKSALTTSIPFHIEGSEISLTVESALLGNPKRLSSDGVPLVSGHARTVDWDTPFGSSSGIDLDIADTWSW